MKRTTIKNTIFLTLALTTATFSALFAQNSNGGALPEKSGNEWQMPKDVLIRSHAFADHLKGLLSLDSTTTQKLFNLYLGNTKSVDEIRVGAGSEDDKKTAMAANQAEFDAKVKEILTPGQFETYLKDKKTRKR